MPTFTWTKDVEEAKKEQLNLRELVKLQTALQPSLAFTSGLAIGTAYEENTKRSFAVGVRFDREGNQTAAPVEAHIEVDFPYRPGLLAFRVGPAVCMILDELSDGVDLLLFDGQGIAHPRGFGLASHFGVLYNKLSIGVTRNNLFGRFTAPPEHPGHKAEILHPRTAALVGYAVSLAEGCSPCYVSPGHNVSIADALTIVSRLTPVDGPLPGPLQRAHVMANVASKRFWRTERRALESNLTKPHKRNK